MFDQGLMVEIKEETDELVLIPYEKKKRKKKKKGMNIIIFQLNYV